MKEPSMREVSEWLRWLRREFERAANRELHLAEEHRANNEEALAEQAESDAEQIRLNVRMVEALLRMTRLDQQTRKKGQRNPEGPE